MAKIEHTKIFACKRRNRVAAGQYTTAVRGVGTWVLLPRCIYTCDHILFTAIQPNDISLLLFIPRCYKFAAILSQQVSLVYLNVT